LLWSLAKSLHKNVADFECRSYDASSESSEIDMDWEVGGQNWRLKHSLIFILLKVVSFLIVHSDSISWNSSLRAAFIMFVTLCISYFRVLFSLSNRVRLLGASSCEYGGWRTGGISCLTKNCCMNAELCSILLLSENLPRLIAISEF